MKAGRKKGPTKHKHGVQLSDAAEKRIQAEAKKKDRSVMYLLNKYIEKGMKVGL